MHQDGQELRLLHLLKRILTAVVLIPIVLLLVLRAPVPVVALVAALVALLTVQELLKLAEAYGIRPLRWPTYIFVGLFFLLLAINPGNDKPLLSTAIFVYSAGFAAAIAPFVFLTIAMRRVDLSSSFPAAMVSAFAFAYVALPLGFLVQLREQWSGAFLLLYLLLLVWAGDIFAYFVGRSLGRHLMSPRISPKKTWEGALASLLASLVVGMLLYNYALPISTALLNAHLIEQARRFLRLAEAAIRTDSAALGGHQHRGAVGRSGGVVDQTRSRSEGFRNDSARPRRHAGPHRCPALCRSGAVVLCGLARDAVVKSSRWPLVVRRWR